MRKWLLWATGFVALVGSVVKGVTYFETKAEASQREEYARIDREQIRKQSQANADELAYQSALRTYELYSKKAAEYPNDPDFSWRRDEALKRVKLYECKLFGACK